MNAAFGALERVLAELTDVVRALSPEQYAAPGPAGVSGSVGGHVRHCLDHIAAFERGLRDGVVDYEARARGTRIEHDRQAGVAALETMRRRITRLDGDAIARLVRVRSQIDPRQAPVHTASTGARELAFVIHHTIHHCAIVNVLLSHVGHATPRGFGMAPGTPMDQDLTCARSA